MINGWKDSENQQLHQKVKSSNLFLLNSKLKERFNWRFTFIVKLNYERKCASTSEGLNTFNTLLMAIVSMLYQRGSFILKKGGFTE